MARSYNTTKDGGSWTAEIIKAVWNKGRIIPNYPPDVWRWDKCGSVMKFSDYGNRNSDNGWEIDHIDPASNGGSDFLFNLQPLNWKNNAAKGDDTSWYCGK